MFHHVDLPRIPQSHNLEMMFIISGESCRGYLHSMFSTTVYVWEGVKPTSAGIYYLVVVQKG